MERRAWIYVVALPPQVALLSMLAFELTGTPMETPGAVIRSLLAFALAISVLARDLRLSIACGLIYLNTLVPQLLGGVFSPRWDEPLLFTLNIFVLYGLFRIRFPTTADHQRKNPTWILIPYASYWLALAVYIFAPLSAREQFYLTNGVGYLTLIVIVVVALGRLFGLLTDGLERT